MFWRKKTRVEKARDNIEKQIRVLNKQGKRTSKEVINNLNSTAHELRSGLGDLITRDQQKQAEKLAHELESIAKNVEKSTEKGLLTATETAQDNVWGTVLITFALGLLVGIIVKNFLD
ncbi:MAG: hypothetical protein WBC91_06020 [Phototrophicaceae bacterium]